MFEKSSFSEFGQMSLDTPTVSLLRICFEYSSVNVTGAKEIRNVFPVEKAVSDFFSFG